jgi:hypothetical protein
MKCPECSFEQPDDSSVCPSCKLIFAKWRDLHANAAGSAPPAEKRRLSFSLLGFMGIALLLFILGYGSSCWVHSSPMASVTGEMLPFPTPTQEIAQIPTPDLSAVPPTLVPTSPAVTTPPVAAPVSTVPATHTAVPPVSTHVSPAAGTPGSPVPSTKPSAPVSAAAPPPVKSPAAAPAPAATVGTK